MEEAMDSDEMTTPVNTDTERVEMASASPLSDHQLQTAPHTVPSLPPPQVPTPHTQQQPFNPLSRRSSPTHSRQPNPGFSFRSNLDLPRHVPPPPALGISEHRSADVDLYSPPTSPNLAAQKPIFHGISANSGSIPGFRGVSRSPSTTAMSKSQGTKRRFGSMGDFDFFEMAELEKMQMNNKRSRHNQQPGGYEYTTHKLRTRAVFSFEEWQAECWKTYRLLVTFVVFSPLCFQAISSLFSLCIFLFFSPFWLLVVWLHLYIGFDFLTLKLLWTRTIDGGDSWPFTLSIRFIYLDSGSSWRRERCYSLCFTRVYTFLFSPIFQCPTCSYSLAHLALCSFPTLLLTTYILALFYLSFFFPPNTLSVFPLIIFYFSSGAPFCFTLASLEVWVVGVLFYALRWCPYSLFGVWVLSCKYAEILGR